MITFHTHKRRDLPFPAISKNRKAQNMQYNPQTEKIIYSKEEFGLRLAMLREQRHISARQMSLDLGQNKNFINSIESGRNYPTMKNFFDICLYLKVTPRKFFGPLDYSYLPYDDFMDLIKKIPPETLEHLYLLMVDFIKKPE